MNTHILYLDFIILASAAYPSGFSNSLFTSWRGVPRAISTEFLSILALPYLAIVPVVWVLRPELLALRGVTAPLLAAAAVLAPVALLIEYGIHTLAFYKVNGKFPRGITLKGFWRQRLSPTGLLPLGTVMVGEEFVYRGIWFSILLSFGLPLPVAVGLSSLAYGVNHLAFGGTAVISKTVTGALYCTLYLFGGKSIWLPIISHGLQNIMLFRLSKERHV